MGPTRRLAGVADHMCHIPATVSPSATNGPSAPIASSNAGLSPSEIDAFNKEGYILVRGAATAEQTARAQRAMYHQLGMTPTDPEGWYTSPPGATPGPFQHITFFGTPHDRAAAAPHTDDECAAWEIAQNPRVHSAFASLWGTDRLWANVEMGSFKPPWRPGLPKYGAICYAGVQPWFSLGDALPMHWDFGVQDLAKVVSPPASGRRDLSAEGEGSSFGLQANLFLNDRGIDGGASCVNAGYIHHHGEWIHSAKGQRELVRMAGIGTYSGEYNPIFQNTPVLGSIYHILISPE